MTNDDIGLRTYNHLQAHCVELWAKSNGWELNEAFTYWIKDGYAVEFRTALDHLYKGGDA